MWTNLLKLSVAIYGAVTGYKMFVVAKLNNFVAAEFGAALPFLSVGLLTSLDGFTSELKETFGREKGRVVISPAPGSLIRFGTDNKEGQHFLGKAVDFFLPYLSFDELQIAFVIAKKHFNGVGISYTWKLNRVLTPGLHGDVRTPKRDGYIASWGYDTDLNGKQIIVAAATAISNYGAA